MFNFIKKKFKQLFCDHSAYPFTLVGWKSNYNVRVMGIEGGKENPQFREYIPGAVEMTRECGNYGEQYVVSLLGREAEEFTRLHIVKQENTK